LEGEVIEGKYHLDRLLSSGSYGGVFSADEVVADQMIRRLAIKLITPSPEYPERQMQELVLATSMDHPNILRCFSPGVCTLNGVRLLYIVMEMASSSLADRFIEGLMTVEETTILAEGLLSALIYLGGGDRPLVHRDIKPANILSVNGTWKLADFGLLRGIGPDRVAQTRTLLGTAEYAPPEAFDGTVSTAWDMWSLGTVLVEALTGNLPFDEASAQELQNAILHSAARHVDGLGDPFEPIVRGCLIKERMARWTAEEALGVIRGTAPKPIVPTTFRSDNARRKAKYPFRFKFDSAETIPELIAACEEYPFEAQDYLMNRYFGKWFGDAMDDPALAREAFGCSQLHWHEPERGLELFLRELRKSAGMTFDPEMAPIQQRLDFGLKSVGEQAHLVLHYRCAARRYVWGTTQLEGNLPGISVDKSFGTADAPVAVRLNLVDVEPGHYEGKLFLLPQGLTTFVSVPVSYTVVPLKVKVSPQTVSFGPIEYGHVSARVVEITTPSPNVKVKGTAAIVPPCPGIKVDAYFEGANVRVNVIANCTELAAGREYVRRIMLDTTAGKFEIPMRLRVEVPVKPIALSVLGGVAIGGVAAALLRCVIDSADPTAVHWFLRYPINASTYETTLRLVGSPIIAFVTGYLFRRFSQWRWPMLYERRATANNRPGVIDSYRPGED
jgi:hypothetical protein